VFRDLRIPSCRERAAFRRKAVSELGEETCRIWDELKSGPEGSSSEFYDLIYRDTAAARILAVGAKSDIIRRELRWLLPRLRRECPAVKPVIIDFGSGCGLGAAIISRALGATVISVDHFENGHEGLDLAEHTLDDRAVYDQ
jgi:hypothetical protein